MKLSLIVLCTAVLALTGCSTHMRSTQDVSFERQARWLVLPLTNRTTTPQAGLRAQAIVEAVLAQHGARPVVAFEQENGEGVLFEAGSEESRQAMRAWVAEQNGRYVVSGVVHEWRYKTGVDGEPAVGVMIEIRDPAGELLFSGTGSRAGWARQSLGETGQRVIDDLIAPVID